ncbi:MAG: hypothetical protein MNPFHGCM_00294 [Gemmatimonadaceae bacterium]|nr:hypothetical protein [Gemmatimonadaceae bacterium]
MPADWTRHEVEALVADYFAMLTAQLTAQEYNKSTHRRALAPLLNNRSDGSIERKHQNVSAILIALGHPPIVGYKPLRNYQGLLAEVVADRLASDAALRVAVQAAVDAPGVIPSVEDMLARWEAPPERPDRAPYGAIRELPRYLRPMVNYLEQEARNSSLGRAGEEFTLRYEKARLIHAGRHALADRVEHVSETLDDSAGFDIHSFDNDGRDRLIEVKTTAYGKQTPFFLSRNELRISQAHASEYHLYRLFRFRDDPRLFGLRGALDETCQLDPVQFSAQVR